MDTNVVIVILLKDWKLITLYIEISRDWLNIIPHLTPEENRSIIEQMVFENDRLFDIEPI